MIDLKIYCAAVWPGEMFTHAGHSSSHERLNFLFSIKVKKIIIGVYKRNLFIRVCAVVFSHVSY